MQQWLLLSWCFVLGAVCSSVRGFHLPNYSSHFARFTRYELWKRESTRWQSGIKRSHGEYERFMDSMARQAHRHRQRDRQAFVEQMFRLFDINRDSVIERNEFRAILQGMGIVPAYRRTRFG